MQKENIKIGIFGGTFDPIHNGHLIVAELIKENFGLGRVVFIPTGDPPHKKSSEVTDADHRYQMLCSAVSSNPDFDVSRIEMDREGTTYTIDTLVQLKKNDQNGSKLFFIIGADVIYDLLTWRDCERVFALCEFIATLRPGFDKVGFIKEINYLKSTYDAKINIAEMPQIEISSTGIRERIKNKKSIKYLVPDSVERYIIEHGLYKQVNT